MDWDGILNCFKATYTFLHCKHQADSWDVMHLEKILQWISISRHSILAKAVSAQQLKLLPYMLYVKGELLCFCLFLVILNEAMSDVPIKHGQTKYKAKHM